MPYGHRLTDWIYKIISEVGAGYSVRVVPGCHDAAPGKILRDEVRSEIDRAFMVIAEASSLSWFVAFELFYALDRKLCYVMLCRDGVPGLTLDRSVRNVIPEQVVRKYRAPLPGDNEDQNIRKIVHRIFRTAQEDATSWASDTSGEFLKGQRLPSRWIGPNIRLRDQSPDAVYKADVNDVLFERWLTTRQVGQRIAIIAPPGLGKTALLTKFANYLRYLRPPEGLWAPIGLFLRTADMPETVDSWNIRTAIEELIWKHERRNYPERNRNSQTNYPYPGLFEAYKKAGLVYLLFDGLDEFASRRRGLSRLMAALSNLSGEGFNLVVTCRKNLWKIANENAGDFQVVEILDFSEDQVELLLDDIVLPDDAYSEGTLKKWILNPLIVRFIIDIHNELGQASDTSKSLELARALKSRSSLYDAWARHTARQEANRLGIDSGNLQSCFRAMALLLLKRRRLSERLMSAKNVLGTICGKLTSMQLSSLSVFDIVESLEGGSRIKFSHESIYEFFAASALKDDFKKILQKELLPVQFGELELAKVELDYLQSSSYGFFSEMLGSELLRRLPEVLDYSELASMPWKLARNLVEFFGLLYDGAQKAGVNEGDVVHLLLTLIEDKNSQLNGRIRYNAARALERIHPQAPRPYFEYVSDSGERSWGSVSDKARARDGSPFVMRGTGRTEPKAGRHWAFAGNDHAKPHDDALQRHVSRSLAAVLESLLSEGRELSPLRINCSNAWIRWYWSGHHGLKAKLLRQAEAVDLEAETLENLSKWVADPEFGS